MRNNISHLFAYAQRTGASGIFYSKRRNSLQRYSQFAPTCSLVVSAYLRVDPSDDQVTLVMQCVTLRETTGTDSSHTVRRPLTANPKVAERKLGPSTSPPPQVSEDLELCLLNYALRQISFTSEGDQLSQWERVSIKRPHKLASWIGMLLDQLTPCAIFFSNNE